MSSLASSSTSPRTTLGPHSIGANLTLEASAGGRQRITGYFLIHMHSLCVLPQVIKSGKSSRTVALERALSGMFSNMASQMLAPCETQVAWREIGTVESLSLLLLRWRCMPLPL